MAVPRLKIASPSELRQIPYEGATVRDRLAEARHLLDRLDPATLDAAEQLLATLHHHLCGRCEAEEIRGDRTGRYRRGQLTGQYDLPSVDLVYLARRDAGVAGALAAFFAALAAPAPALESLATSGRGVAVNAGELAGRLLEAVASDGVDAAEARELEDVLDALESATALLRGGLRDIARRERR